MAKAHPRRYPRLKVHVKADYTLGAQSLPCMANCLSGGGLFLTQVGSLEPGNQLSVRFRPARNLPVIRARASVRYNLGPGTAVEFTEITTEDRHVLLRFIHRKTGDRKTLHGLPLVAQIQTEQSTSLAFARDLSLCGTFIETKELPPVGSPLMLRFNLDEKGRVVITSAHVAYHIEKMGMGVLFSELSPAHRNAIEDYIGRH